MILMELFKWAAIGIGSAAAVIIFVALLNTLYHRLVIRRRTKKLDPFLEDWERHQIQGRMLRHGRAPEAKHFVLVQPDVPDKFRTPYPTEDKRKAVLLGSTNHVYNAQRPILYVPHSMWCPTCGGHSLDVRQPGEGSLPTYQCAGCGQGFCVKPDESKSEEDRNTYLIGDNLDEFLSKVATLSPDVETDLYNWSPDRDSVVTNPNFGGGDFAGGGAGQDYDSSDSSSDSGSSYDSGSSDSDYGGSSDNSND